MGKKGIYLLLFSFLFCVITQAQSVRKFREAISPYFISLPYDKVLGDWIKEIENHPGFIKDTSIAKRKQAALLLAGRLRHPVFAGVDSAFINIFRSTFFTKRTLNGREINASVDTSYVISQSYLIPDSSLSPNDWKTLCKNLRKTFGKYSSVTYPRSTSSEQTMEMIWFRLGMNIQPELMLTYGHLKERHYYLLSYQLHFSIASAE